MSARLPSKAGFDALQPTLEALARDWVARECTSFDAAVLGTSDGSIWDMPAIDSKRVVALLVELEGVVGNGCTIPVSVIAGGGYGSADDLVTKLLPRIRERCPDAQTGLPPTSPPSTPPSMTQARPQVIR